MVGFVWDEADCMDAFTQTIQGRKERMKRKPKKTDYRQGLEPWLNNKRKNEAYRKQKEADAEARFLEKCIGMAIRIYKRKERVNENESNS